MISNIYELKSLFSNFLADCFYNDGYMQGGAAQHIRDVYDEYSCAIRVHAGYPEASGATMYQNNSCWAEFGEFMILSHSHRTCSFQGSSKSGIFEHH